MDSGESSNSVSRPRAHTSTEKIHELPKSSLKKWGDKLFIFRNQRLIPVTMTPDGLYTAKTRDVRWLVRLV